MTELDKDDKKLIVELFVPQGVKERHAVQKRHPRSDTCRKRFGLQYKKWEEKVKKQLEKDSNLSKLQNYDPFSNSFQNGFFVKLEWRGDELFVVNLESSEYPESLAVNQVFEDASIQCDELFEDLVDRYGLKQGWNVSPGFLHNVAEARKLLERKVLELETTKITKEQIRKDCSCIAESLVTLEDVLLLLPKPRRSNEEAEQQCSSGSTTSQEETITRTPADAERLSAEQQDRFRQLVGIRCEFDNMRRIIEAIRESHATATTVEPSMPTDESATAPDSPPHDTLTTVEPSPPTDESVTAPDSPPHNKPIYLQNEWENPCGKLDTLYGGDADASIYGEMTAGSMVDIMAAADRAKQVDTPMVFLDIGAGTMRCAIQAAFEKGWDAAGFENSENRVFLGASNCLAANKHVQDLIHKDYNTEQDKAWESIGQIRIAGGDAMHVRNFNGFTVVFMFDEGFIPSLMEHIGKCWNNSNIKVQLIISTKTGKERLDKVKDANGKRLFSNLKLIEGVSVYKRYSHSGNTAYVFKRTDGDDMSTGTSTVHEGEGNDEGATRSPSSNEKDQNGEEMSNGTGTGTGTESEGESEGEGNGEEAARLSSDNEEQLCPVEKLQKSFTKKNAYETNKAHYNEVRDEAEAVMKEHKRTRAGRNKRASTDKESETLPKKSKSDKPTQPKPKGTATTETTTFAKKSKSDKPTQPKPKGTATTETTTFPKKAKSKSKPTQPKPKPKGTATSETKILLLGMVTKGEETTGQANRDHHRIAKMKELSKESGTTLTVCTVSLESGLTGSHLNANFTHRKFPFEVREEFVKDESQPFQEIFLDYFWSPSSWTEVRWTRGFFESILSRLSTEDILAHGGTVYLPFSAYVFKHVMTYKAKLLEQYTISYMQKEDFDKLIFVKAAKTCTDAELGGKATTSEITYSTTTLQQVQQQADAKITQYQLEEHFQAIKMVENVRFIKLTRHLEEETKKETVDIGKETSG
jgi:hypothetical protein